MPRSEAIVDAGRADIAPDVRLGDGTVIRADEVVLGPGVSIAEDVTIEARTVRLGHGAAIAAGCTLRGIGGPAERLDVGGRFFLGPSSTVLVPVFVAGDYVAIHNHLLCNGYKPMVIGHNTWVGQNCVLNSTDDLVIGNNVGIGAYSSVYTHAFHGELLEGCEIFQTAPVVIEDNAWLVGAYNVVSPGVTIGSRGTVLTSSVVTKDIPPAHVVAGVPAKDLTERLTAFRDVTLEDKLGMLRRFVGEFVDERHAGQATPTRDGFQVTPADGPPFFLAVQDRLDLAALGDGPGAVYAGVVDGDASPTPDDVTVFDVATKRYAKRRTPLEVDLIGFMNGYRARFVPDDRPRLSAAA